MILLGTIARLQIQLQPLKSGEGRQRVFSPAGIVSVPSIDLTPAGITADIDGRQVVDAHHPIHPRSRNRGGNGLSIGVTGHYAAMRERFGDRVVDGVAGENLIVEHAGIIEYGDVAAGLAIETAGGLLRLDEILPAPPCAEFSRYLLNFPEGERPDTTVTEAIRFLDHGIRGFYATPAGSGNVRVGDRVFARMAGE
jgi:hypothetical protein